MVLPRKPRKAEPSADRRRTADGSDVRSLDLKIELGEPPRRVAAAPQDTGSLRILLLCNYDPFNAATVCDHINAFVRYSRHDVFVLSRIGDLPGDVDLDAFDAIIVHYSLFVALESYMPPRARERLKRARGLKVLFIQDEYRFVRRTQEAIRACGITLVYTCVPTPHIDSVYDPEALPGVSFVNTLTGYVPFALTQYEARPLLERPIDVGYRGREYPAWHGSAGREKVRIGRQFLKDASGSGLRCDIRWDENGRLYGAQWINFIQRCRAVLAVESGASVFDFEGKIGPRVEAFAALTDRRPTGLRSLLSRTDDGAENARYERLRERFFAEEENRIDLSQLSPRVFEAAALRTLLIMYEGRYSGVFEPWRHFVPLKKDHSNMTEVVATLRDADRVAEIVSAAYAEIASDPRYGFARFIAEFDKRVEELSDTTGRHPLDAEQFRDDHPFYLVDNPHALTRPRARKQLLGAARRVRDLLRLRPGSE